MSVTDIVLASPLVSGQFRCLGHCPVFRQLLLPHLLHCLRLLRDSGDQPPAEGSAQGPEGGVGERPLPPRKGPHLPPRGSVPAMAVPQHW